MAHGRPYLDKLAAFEAWDDANPVVGIEFDALATRALKKGEKDFSAWAIVGHMRTERAITPGAPRLHVSNDFIAFYARRWMAKDPAARGQFFVLKPMQGEDFAATKAACGVVKEAA